jgi:glycosyltransferase involved in cell wall biosynthesis
MYQGHHITAVIPAHNEAKHIRQVLQCIPDWVDQLIVVDDSSQDETFQVAKQTEDPRVLILRTPKNLGVGGATLLGYRKALEQGSDIIIKMDGDGQMDSKYLPDLIDPLIKEGYQYTKGNRFLAGESLDFMPRSRLLGNLVLTFSTKLASGYWHVFDPQNGYTAIKAATLNLLNLDTVHQRYFFENDMLVHLNLLGCRVKDVAIPAIYGEEKSDLNPIKVGIVFPFLLLKGFVRRIYQKYILRDFSPIALFLILGTLSFGWGTLFGLIIWIRTYLTGIATPTGTIMLALLPLILGFQLILQAIVLDIQESPK